MQKATTNDIGAICSRIDAQTVIMIEMLATINGSILHPSRGCSIMSVGEYTKRYDELAKKYRKGMVDF
jgi:hypothetical protein